MDTSDLAKRMKNYEYVTRNFLVRRMPVVMRLDSRAGHTFTKGFKRPFDEIFMKSMQETAKYLCENVQGCQCAYIQSDEITLLLVDYEKLNTEAWFDYRIDKMLSISAAMATLAFNKYFISNAENYIDDWYESEGASTEEESNYIDALRESMKKGLMFDSRVFNLPKEEVANNFYWRQLDASRNSIQMVGQSNFSHNELQYKSCNDIQDMLITQKGINWNDFPTYQKRGSCVVRNKYVSRHYYSTITGENKEYDLRDSTQSENAWVIDKDIPIFKGDGREYIEQLINVGEE